MTDLIPADYVESNIFLIRGRKVMLDRDLARLYGVATKNLNKAVSRNKDRFPEDFVFRLTPAETLRFHNGTSKNGQGGRRYLPYAFTEQGVAMLSSVLRSKRAVSVNIEIMRAFMRLRELLLTHADLARKLATLENKYDGQFKQVFNAIKRIMRQKHKPRPKIGFRVGLSSPRS